MKFSYVIVSMVLFSWGGLGCTDHVTPKPDLGEAEQSGPSAELQALPNSEFTVWEYDLGTQPAVAVSSTGLAAEVHKDAQNRVVYRVSNANDAKVDGSNSTQHFLLWPGTGDPYSSLSTPGIAVNSKNQIFVIIDQTYDGDQIFRYRVIKVDANRQQSTGASGYIPGTKEYDWVGDYAADGTNPSAAFVTDSRLIVAYQNGKYLYYAMGTLSDDGNSIKWDTNRYKGSTAYDQGDNPSIAVNSRGQVVETHNADANTLMMRIGQVNADQSGIDWYGEAFEYTNGNRAAVSLDDDGTVVEIHQSSVEDKITRLGGYISSFKFNLFSTEELGTGAWPGVGLKNGKLAGVWEGGNGNKGVFTSSVDLNE